MDKEVPLKRGFFFHVLIIQPFRLAIDHRSKLGLMKLPDKLNNQNYTELIGNEK